MAAPRARASPAARRPWAAGALLAAAVAVAAVAVAVAVAAPAPARATAAHDHDHDHHAHDHAEADIQSGGSDRKHEGASLDESTRQGILASVPMEDECRFEVERFVYGELAQTEMQQSCQKVLMQAYQTTPVGKVHAREQQTIQMAALARVPVACRDKLRSARSEEDIPVHCIGAFKTKMQEMTQWMGMATFSKLSQTCKSEVEALRAASAASGGGVPNKDISPACLEEMQSVKPGLLDTLEEQTAKRMEDGKEDDEPPPGAQEFSQQQQQQQQQRRRAAAADEGAQDGEAGEGEDARAQERERQRAAARPRVIKSAGAWKGYLFPLIGLVVMVAPIVYAYARYFREHSGFEASVAKADKGVKDARRERRQEERVRQRRKQLGLAEG